MSGRKGRPPIRREPDLERGAQDPGELDIRLSPQDRAGAAARRPARARLEPTFEPRLDMSRERPRAARKAAPMVPVEELEEFPDDDEPIRPAKSAKSRRVSAGRARRGAARRRGLGSLLRRGVYWSFLLSLWGVVALIGLVVYHASKLPPIDQLAVPKRPPNIAIMAGDGSLLANRGETGGRTVTLSELPPYLPNAFIAIEDHRFRLHYGIDPLGIARALVRNVTQRGGPMQGGSTLTQQLAKNLFLTQERTASRKIQEAILALWLERNYSKDQILELYLNRVYFGSGAYGVEAAAQKYFGKSARAVTLAEAAILGGLVQAPSRLAPNRNLEAAQARAALVIAAMAREGLISDQMAKAALARPAEAVRQAGASSANYAADYVMDVLDDFIGTIDRDIIVATTIDGAMQSAAEKALTEELAAKGGRFGVSQGAFVAMQPDGAIKALVGGRDYSESQFNRASGARRQPGSAFKPFVYQTAIEKGLTPDTMREDAPINIKGWQPENYSRDYKGSVSLRTALATSLNTVAVRLALEVGPKAVVKTAARMGIQSKLEPNASLALGTSEVTPLELVGAFAPYANGGIGVMPFVITQVKTRDGEVIYRRVGGGLGRVADPATIAAMNAMLRETLLTGTARKADLPNWEAAGKTGTSQDFRDAWFIGYTSALIVGVWLGNDDNSPSKRASGGTLPVEIWSRFMRQALAGTPPAPLPGGQWCRPAPVPGELEGEAVAMTGAAPPPTGAAPRPVLEPARPAPAAAPPASGPLILRSATPDRGAPSLPPAADAALQPFADGAPRPPAAIPGVPGGAPSAPPASGERNFFGRLFGG